MSLLKRTAGPAAGRREAKRSVDPGAAPLPSWIRWGRWILPLAVLIFIGGALTLRAHSGPRELRGGAIASSRQLAPDFTLTDQFGKTGQLTDFRGKPVALTFIYTNCADVCPLIA